MAGKCKLGKDNIETINDNDQRKEQEAIDNSVIERINEKLIEKWYEKYLPGIRVDEKVANDFLEKYWGSEQELIASKIEALLDGTSMVVEMFSEYVFEHLPVGVKLRKGKDLLYLRNFPVKSLKLYYNFLLNLVSQTNPTGQAWMNFGGVLSAFKTPRKLARWEPTGAYFHIAKETREFPRRIAHNINLVMFDVKGMKRLAKKLGLKKDEIPTLGMGSIYSQIKYLITDKGDPHLVQELFHRYMMGWIFLNEDNEFMIYKDYDIVPIRNKENKIIGFERYDDGSFVYQFQNPVKLKNYEEKTRGIKKGGLNVIFRGKQLNEFIKLTEEARKVDNFVFAYSKKVMKDSLDNLLTNLVEYMGIGEEAVRAIFFSPESKLAKNTMKSLNSDQLKQFRILREVFETKISDELIMANGGRIDITGGTVEYKKNHFPIVYHKWAYLSMLDSMIDEFERYVSEMEDVVNDKSQSREVRAMAIKDLAEYKAKLRNAKSVRDNYDGYHTDVMNDVLLNFSRDAKHFKRISNAYDIRSARTDGSVYYDYAKSIFSAAERNNLAASLVKSLMLTDSPVVNRASVNMFKIPFADPSIEGLFGISVKKIAEASGMNTERLERRLRKLSNYLTAMYLGGFMTPITNVSAIGQNIYDYGFTETMRAFKLMFPSNKSNYKDAWPKIQEIIQMSGVTDMGDFFSQSMVNGIVGVQLERDVAAKIIGHMLLYHDRIRKGMSKSESRKIFEKDVAPVLESSTAWLSVEGFMVRKKEKGKIVIPKEKRLKKRRKEVRADWLEVTINKLVQFSIEKKFEFKKSLDKVPLSEALELGKNIRNAALAIGMFYGATLKKIGLTMSDTESFIRALSFIIGVNRAWDGGYLRNDIHWWNYTNSEDIGQVLSIGALLSEFTNFGLSSQSVSRMGHGAIGKLLVKFKNWPIQKFSRDMSVIYNAYIENKELIKIENKHPGYFTSFSPKAVGKVLSKLVKLPDKSIRLTDPQMATMREWFWIQGPLTILWDFFIAGPWKIPSLTSYVYGTVVGKSTRNFTSDLISLMFMPFNIAARIFMVAYFDEEDAERAWTYYLRRTMLGYVPMAMWDFFLMLAYGTSGSPEKAIEKAPIPLYPSIVRGAKELSKQFVK